MDKLKKQIERYKGKLHRRCKKGEWIPSVEISEKEDNISISKRKKFSTSESMHEEEACEQLELLGHEFFVFKNRDTGLYNVVYKRSDGTYGLIELKDDYIVDRED